MSHKQVNSSIMVYSEQLYCVTVCVFVGGWVGVRQRETVCVCVYVCVYVCVNS